MPTLNNTCNGLVSMLDCTQRGKGDYNVLAKLCNVGERLQLSLVRERVSSYHQFTRRIRLLAKIQSHFLPRMYRNRTLGDVGHVRQSSLDLTYRSRLWPKPSAFWNGLIATFSVASSYALPWRVDLPDQAPRFLFA